MRKVASPHRFLEIDITPFQTKPVISTKTAPLKLHEKETMIFWDTVRLAIWFLVTLFHFYLLNQPTMGHNAIYKVFPYIYMQDLFSHLFRFTELSFAKQQIPQVIYPLCILGYLMCAFYSRPNVKTWSRGSLSACRGIMIRPSPPLYVPVTQAGWNHREHIVR